MSEGWTPKAGDKVRVIRNKVTASNPHDLTKLLEPGDIIEVSRVEFNSYHKCNVVIYQFDNLDGVNCIPVADIEPVIDLPVCTCPIQQLAAYGCKCGAFAREMDIANGLPDSHGRPDSV